MLSLLDICLNIKEVWPKDCCFHAIICFSQIVCTKERRQKSSCIVYGSSVFHILSWYKLEWDSEKKATKRYNLSRYIILVYNGSLDYLFQYLWKKSELLAVFFMLSLSCVTSDCVLCHIVHIWCCKGYRWYYNLHWRRSLSGTVWIYLSRISYLFASFHVFFFF